MRTNTATAVAPARTHEGARASRINAYQSLRRSVLATMLWEDSAYEDGTSVASRIAEFVPKCRPQQVSALAIEARSKFNLRHVPLFLVREMVRHESHRSFVAHTLDAVIQRPDEIGEFLALYFKDSGTSKRNNGKGQPLPSQVKKGIGLAFRKFSEYQLAKYNGGDAAIKLRDALFLCHAKPKDSLQESLWKRLIAGTLKTPDTWEVELSQSTNKKASWERLLTEDKLGALALLRNLRNMLEAGVDLELIRTAITFCKADRVLPFRFIAAARHAPRLEPELEALMLKGLQQAPKLSGRTVLLVDHSLSMDESLSSKSDMTRFEAACALAMLVREVCTECEVVAYSAPVPKEHAGYRQGKRVVDATLPPVALVPPRHGFALRDAIEKAVPWYGTNTEDGKKFCDKIGYDRIIIFTDEQSAQNLSGPAGIGYVVNVSNEKHGVGYGRWNHIDGFSEAVIDFIRESEAPIPS